MADEPVTQGGSQESTVQGAVPEAQQAGVSGSQVEAPSNDTASTPKRGNPEFGRLRAQNRELRQELDGIKQQMSDLASVYQGPTEQTQQQTSESVNLFEQPDQWKESFKKEVLDQVRAEASSTIREQQEKKDAYQWLLSQDGVTEESEDELVDIMQHDNELSSMIKDHPQAAAELAYRRFMDRRRDVDKQAKAQAGGVRGGSLADAGGQSLADLGNVAKNASDEEYLKKRDMILREFKKARGET